MQAVHVCLCNSTADGSGSKFTQLFIKALHSVPSKISFGKPHLTSCAHNHCITCEGKTAKNTFAINH